MTRCSQSSRHGGVIGVTLVAVVLATGACGSNGYPSAVGRAAGVGPAPTTTAPPQTGPATAAASAYPSVAVTDPTGAAFSVTAQPVTSTPVINVGGAPRYAAPGDTYLVETMTVAGESLSSVGTADFDDPDTGLAPDIELTLDPATAAAHGYGSVCGVEPGLPTSWCPVALGQGLIVDSVAATAASACTPSSSGGASGCGLTVVLSYGPVLQNFPVTSLSVWFDAAPLPPQKLST